MNNILNITDSLLNNIFNNQNYIKGISIICLLYIVYIISTEPSSIIILLFNNKYFVVLYLLFIFYINIYNQFISVLLAIIFCIIIDKLYRFKLLINSYNGGSRRKKEQYHIKKDVLSYFLT